MRGVLLTREWVKKESPNIAEAVHEPAPVVETILNAAIGMKENNKRGPAPPAPKGGISICEAARQYNIYHQTISRWVLKGRIRTLRKTGYKTYIDAGDMARVAAEYAKNPGQGKRTVKKATN